MKKRKAQNIFEFLAVIFIAIKIAILGTFSIGEELNTSENPENKPSSYKEENFLPISNEKIDEVDKILKEILFSEVYDNDCSLNKKADFLEQNINEFNEIIFAGKEPTLEDVDYMLQIYKKHVSEYMRSNDFSSEQMKKRIETLKKDLNYIPPSEKNKLALKKLTQLSDEIIKTLELQEIDEIVKNLEVEEKTKEKQTDFLIENEPYFKELKHSYEDPRKKSAKDFERAIDIIRKSLRDFFNNTNGKPPEKD